MDIKIYGPIRSGTNFLEFLIRNNLGVEPLVNQFAWKHSVFINEDIQAFNAIMYKNVYAWTQSVYQYSKSTNFFKMPKNSMKSFIRSPFVFRERSANLDSANIVQFYNECYASWLNSGAEKIFINYENLLLSTKDQLNKLAQITGNMIVEEIVYPVKNILPHESKTIKKTTTFNYHKENYYKNKQYMSGFDAEDIDFIESNLDKNIIEGIFSMTLQDLKIDYN